MPFTALLAGTIWAPLNRWVRTVKALNCKLEKTRLALFFRFAVVILPIERRAGPASDPLVGPARVLC